MRLPLLEHLPAIAADLPARALNEQVFPQLALGFGDASAQVRTGCLSPGRGSGWVHAGVWGLASHARMPQPRSARSPPRAAFRSCARRR